VKAGGKKPFGGKRKKSVFDLYVNRYQKNNREGHSEGCWGEVPSSIGRKAAPRGCWEGLPPPDRKKGKLTSVGRRGAMKAGGATGNIGQDFWIAKKHRE